jgi:hypothetical protein
MTIPFEKKQAPPAIVVLERHGYWAAMLRIQMSTRRIVETRNWSDCRTELSIRRRSVVWIEVAIERWENSVMRIHDLHGDFPGIPVVVAIERGWAEIELLLCEAGTCCVINSVRQMPIAVALIQNFFSSFSETPELSLADLRDRLPWT